MGIAPARPLSLVGTLGRHRPLLVNLLRREIRQRYKGSALGLLWTFIAPLTVMVAYSAVFHYVYRVVEIDDYPLFLLSGMVGWFFFAGSALAASQSLVANANLIKKVRFPRQLIPFSVVGGQGVTMLAMLVVLVPINLIVVPDSRSPALVLLPIALALLGVMTYGFSLIVAALNVYFRDVEHILAAILLPWFFLTPIFYTPELFPDGVKNLAWLVEVLDWGNWMAPFVYVIRDSMFFGQWPDPGQLGYCAGVAVAFLLAGTFVFRRLDGEMAVEL
jgi:ABC-type polysaccharide/polyol phosphate export permease